MRIIENVSQAPSLSLRQRYADVFTVLVFVILILLGLNFRSRVLNATVFYESPQAGISASYPQNWLLDTQGDYVFRVRDMSRTGYKTTFQVAVRPVGEDAEERNVADRLSLERLPVLTDYTILSDESFDLPGVENTRALSYSYTSSNASPFLQAVPSVVRGLDILVIQAEQAIIITYRADVSIYHEEYHRFENFLRRLQF